jgi:DNA repair exonuclease SbcCD ATPase subunit
MAVTKTINLEVNTKDAQKSLKGLEKGVDDVNKEVKDTSKSTQQMGGTLDKVTGGAVSKFNSFKGALTSVTTGFKSLKVAIIATGIGALLIAVTALGQAFTRSEEGQNKFAKILGVIGSVTGNLLDLLADLGEAIISAFTNPIQALKNFQKSVTEFVTDKINGVIDSFGLLGSAIKKAFSGDFSGALEDAKDGFVKLNNNINPVKIAVDAVAKSVKNLAKEIKADATAAAKIADQRAEAEKQARKLIVERAQAEQDIARLREKAVNKEKFTAQERIEFLEEAGKISEELAAKETEVAKLRLQAKLTENELTKSNKDDLNEAAQLEASVIQLETQRLNLQKRLSTELLTARREAATQAKKDAKEEPVVVDEKLKKIQEIQKAYKQKQEDADAESELQKIALEQERKLAELERLEATEAQKAEVIAFYQNKIQDVKDKNAKQDEELGKLKTQQALGDAKNTFNQIAQLAGKDSKIGKAMAIASATISGVQGVMNAYTTAQKSPITVGFPAYPVVQASLAGLVAAKNIAAIKSINPSGGGGGSIPTQSSGGGSTPPAFNVVGQSGETQLADAIGSQTQRPSRAYVVSNDVTTAQEMDRNIIEGASI